LGRDDQIFDDKSFPTRANHRMSRKRVPVAYVQKRMNDPTVPHRDLWRLQETLAKIVVRRSQPAYKQQIDQQIDMPCDRLSAHH
jgi:hypothetical protein